MQTGYLVRYCVARSLAVVLVVGSLLLTSVTYAMAQEPVAPDTNSNHVYVPLIGGPNLAGTAGSPSAAAPLSFTFVTPLAGGPSLAHGQQATGAETVAAATAAGAPVKLIVDTDPGVDDAVALIWLLSQTAVQVQPLGIVSVAGNADLANTTNNVLTVLDWLNMPNIPVVRGAAAPLEQKLSKTSWFLNGPDGLWGLGVANPHNISKLPDDAAKFYCQTLKANGNVTVLALGPLTNVAKAVKKCPDTFKQQGTRIVALGAAKYGGNKTPVTEFNVWQDPEAAARVAEAGSPIGLGLPVTFVPLDGFSQTTTDISILGPLMAGNNNAIKALLPALGTYIGVQAQNSGIAVIPDAVAAVLALSGPQWGTAQSALTKIELEGKLTRGESVIGLSVAERVAMIAPDRVLSDMAERTFSDPSFNLQNALFGILMSEPDNTQVYMTVKPDLLADAVWATFTR